jgi:mannose-6-phosphate isomerase-like protein (cupin superfamily)
MTNNPNPGNIMKAFVKTICMILFACLLSVQSHAQQNDVFLKFILKELLSQQKLKKTNSIEFLKESTLSGTIRHIGKNETVNSVFGSDMACYIVGGTGKVKIGSNTFALSKGTMVFIPRNLPFLFFEVELPLDIFQLVSFENKSKGDTAALSFSPAQIETGRNAGQNAWNPFLKSKSMIYGLYMLPKKLNGDSALTHRWDEVNQITKGSGKFQVGERIMDVEPGDVIYVKKGNPHFFHTLQDDLYILILFEMRSIQKE